MNPIKEYAIYIIVWLVVGIVLMFQNNKKEVEDLQELTEKMKEKSQYFKERKDG